MNEKLVKSKMDLAKVRAQNQRGVKTGFKILGSGPLNRDGVPQIPPEQKSVDRWPVLDLGVDPLITKNDWKLMVGGLCDHPFELTYSELLKMKTVEDVSDFHCVTGWSKLGVKWRGVLFSELAKKAEISNDVKFVYVEAYDGYSTNVTLEEAQKYDVLLVFEADGEPLPKEHGGPVRMITPQLWAWKGAKWIKSIEFRKDEKRGFWELRGYSNSAIPWLNDRYTQDEVNDEGPS